VPLPLCLQRRYLLLVVEAAALVQLRSDRLTEIASRVRLKRRDGVRSFLGARLLLKVEERLVVVFVVFAVVAEERIESHHGQIVLLVLGSGLLVLVISLPELLLINKKLFYLPSLSLDQG
jgi:hypothetical protein